MAVGYQVKFETITVGKRPFEIRSLKDRQQYDDPAGESKKAGVSAASWPLFGVVWPSGMMLADIMDTYPADGLRILEVGCGLGLASLVMHSHGADITASDYHPMAEKFMDKNIDLNKFAPIKFEVINWATIDNSLGKFDLIIGSDVLYEPNHPLLLANFIERHADGNCKVIIVDPGRRQRTEFTRRMVENGYSLIPGVINGVLADSLEFKGKVLVYTRD
jgi:predicted nicotinamide N-methyase